MPSKIRIFTSELCPPCQELKKKLKDTSNIEFIDVHSDQGYKEAIEKRITGVPYAIKNGKRCRIIDEGDGVSFDCGGKDG